MIDGVCLLVKFTLLGFISWWRDTHQTCMIYHNVRTGCVISLRPTKRIKHVLQFRMNSETKDLKYIPKTDYASLTLSKKNAHRLNWSSVMRISNLEFVSNWLTTENDLLKNQALLYQIITRFFFVSVMVQREWRSYFTISLDLDWHFRHFSRDFDKLVHQMVAPGVVSRRGCISTISVQRI